MNEEDLLSRIGSHAREEGADDAVWERVARGEASAEELADLERRAKDDPDVAAMLAATRPLGSEAEARITERLAPAHAKARARVVSIPRSRDLGRRALAYVGPVALAAAVILYVVAGRHPRSADEGPELPVYGVTALGQQAMRGPAEPATRLHLKAGADAGFEIVARPATAASERIVAYVFVVGGGSRIRPRSMPRSRSPRRARCASAGRPGRSPAHAKCASSSGSRRRSAGSRTPSRARAPGRARARGGSASSSSPSTGIKGT